VARNQLAAPSIRTTPDSFRDLYPVWSEQLTHIYKTDAILIRINSRGGMTPCMVDKYQYRVCFVYVG